MLDGELLRRGWTFPRPEEVALNAHVMRSWRSCLSARDRRIGAESMRPRDAGNLPRATGREAQLRQLRRAATVPERHRAESGPTSPWRRPLLQPSRRTLNDEHETEPRDAGFDVTSANRRWEFIGILIVVVIIGVFIFSAL